MLAVIRRRTAAPVAPPARAKGQLRAGLRYIKHDVRGRPGPIVLVATIGVLGLNMPVILAAFADDEFSTGVGGYSLFNSLTAVGALTGAILSARRVPRCCGCARW